MKTFKQFNEDLDDPKLCMSIPLFIRMLEYAREDAKTDMDLHVVTENAIELMEKNPVLCMDHYKTIVGAK